MTDFSEDDNQNDDSQNNDSLEQLLGQGAQILRQSELQSDGRGSKQSQDKTAMKCPVCHEPVEEGGDQMPFCSKRCRTIDLGKWVSGDYKISRPVEEADLDQDD